MSAPFRAAVLRQVLTPFSLEDVTALPLAAGRVRVRTHASPFCVTDVANWAGTLAKVPPTILGHASVGEVIELGPGVSRVSLGQRVIIPGTPECGTCYFCGVGEPWQCSELFDLGGVYPDIAIGADGARINCAGCVGGYSEQMIVSENQAFPVHTDLPSDVLSMLGCGISTGVGSVTNVAEVRPGESVVVIGAGSVGQWALQAARFRGAASIIVIEPNQHRRELALSHGATYAFDPEGSDPVEAILALTERRGADVVIEAAGPIAAQRLAVTVSRRGARIVFTGFDHGSAEISLPQIATSLQSRRIMSAQNGNVLMRRELPALISLLERGVLDPRGILTTRYSLDQLDLARERSASQEDITGVIVFPVVL